MSDLPQLVGEVPERTWADTARLYVEIARPRVIALVVFTGLPALLLGQSRWPSPSEAFWVLAGTALAGAASSAFNAWVERESDARMARTRRRPLPAAILLPGVVLAYGVILTVLSTIVLFSVGGAWPAAIGLLTIAFYVGVYTVWLKPRTPQNIVIGGAAGATAPLIASAAMTGSTPTLGAWLLFLIVFLWTPPHFWAIAIVRKREYESAGFPMMPSVVGDQATRWRSLAYAVALLPASLAPVWLAGASPAYGLAATVLGGWFVLRVALSLVERRAAADQRVFRGSIVYLGLLFVALIADLMFAR